MNKRKVYVSDRILFAVAVGVLLFVMILLLLFYVNLYGPNPVTKTFAVFLTLIYCISFALL